MKEVKTEKAPAAVGPYSQGIAANNLIFCSGQIALNPETGALVSGGVAAETEQALANLAAVLEVEGLGLDAVAMVNIYLKNMSDFAAVNAVYEKHFSTKPQPARVTVGVAELPKGALVEISCVACKNV